MNLTVGEVDLHVGILQISFLGLHGDHRVVLFLRINVLDDRFVQFAGGQEVVPFQLLLFDAINDVSRDKRLAIADFEDGSRKSSTVATHANLLVFEIKYDRGVNIDDTRVLFSLHLFVEFHRIVGDSDPGAVDEDLDFTVEFCCGHILQFLNVGLHIFIE